MAKKESLVFNGYRIPGGKGGAAVLFACKLIRQNPGIKQAQLINMVTQWAGLNLSTAGWITSPGDKSPAEILWERRKEGRGFKCYPNEHTPDIDPRLYIRDVVTKEFDKNWHQSGAPVVGDLVKVVNYTGNHEIGMLVGFNVYRSRSRSDEAIPSRESLDDLSHYELGAFSVQPIVMIGQARRVCVTQWVSRVQE